MLDQGWDELEPLLAFRTLEFICIMCGRIQVVAQRGEGPEHSLAEKACICSAIEWARWSNIIIDNGRRSGTCPFDSFRDANVRDNVEALDSMGYLMTGDAMAPRFNVMCHGWRRCEEWRAKWTFGTWQAIGMCRSHLIVLQRSLNNCTTFRFELTFFNALFEANDRLHEVQWYGLFLFRWRALVWLLRADWPPNDRSHEEQPYAFWVFTSEFLWIGECRWCFCG